MSEYVLDKRIRSVTASGRSAYMPGYNGNVSLSRSFHILFGAVNFRVGRNAVFGHSFYTATYDEKENGILFDFVGGQEITAYGVYVLTVKVLLNFIDIARLPERGYVQFFSVQKSRKFLGKFGIHGISRRFSVVAGGLLRITGAKRRKRNEQRDRNEYRLKFFCTSRRPVQVNRFLRCRKLLSRRNPALRGGVSPLRRGPRK